MKILILGAGVIGTTYAWQLSNAGHDVTLLARKSKRGEIERDGINIRCRDERKKNSGPIETTYHPIVTDELQAQDDYELIIVCVRAHQLDDVMPVLAQGSGEADILFFSNNWWGDRIIHGFLPAEKYLFGFSRLVGGWRTRTGVECIIFNNPELVTLLGEKDGHTTPRLQKLYATFEKANLKPVISQDIQGWLGIHYVEFLGVIGGILKAGSYDAFVSDARLVKEAVLATRESFEICKAHGVDFKKAAPTNIRIVASAPLVAITPLVQMQYRTPSIKQFFEESIEHGMQEICQQYRDVLDEGKRLQVKMTQFEKLEKFFTVPKARES